MKKAKKKLLILLSSFAFIALMLFNVSVSMEDTGSYVDISLSGISAIASCENHENGCDPGGGYCYTDTSCPAGSSYGAVACYGANYCYASPFSHVDCDGVVSWC